MLPWKLRKRQILPVNQNLLSVYFSPAKFQLVSCNLSLAMIWQMTYTHKLPKLCSATLKLYWQAKLRSIDSCQNGTCADHYQKTNNVGSGSLRYKIWNFPLQEGRICLTHTGSLLMRIFAVLMKVN